MTDGYRRTFTTTLAAGCFVVIAAVTGMAPAERGSAFGGLRPGMAITLTEAAGRFEIGVMPSVPGPLGHEVTAVGEDYVAVKALTAPRKPSSRCFRSSA